jgi:hypothetical protein
MTYQTILEELIEKVQTKAYADKYDSDFALMVKIEAIDNYAEEAKIKMKKLGW